MGIVAASFAWQVCKSSRFGIQSYGVISVPACDAACSSWGIVRFP